MATISELVKAQKVAKSSDEETVCANRPEA